MSSFVTRLPLRNTTPLRIVMSADDVTSSATTSNASWPTAAEEQSGDNYFELIWYGVIVPILYGLVTILGVTGNSLVIYVIMTRERMRTVTNLLLLNLAIADLCFVVVIPPPTAYVMAADRWPFGDIPCRLMHYLVNVTAYVTVYTLVLIALIRYMTIVHTTRTARFRTSRHVVGAIAGVWILMLALNIPVLVSYSEVLQSATPNATATPVADGIVEVTSMAYADAGAPLEGDTDAAMVATAASDDEHTTSAEASAACQVANTETGQRVFITFFVFAYLLPLCVIAGFSIGIVRHITRHKAPNTASSVSSSGSRVPGSARSCGGSGSTCGAPAAIGSAVSSVSSSSGGRRKGSHSANRKRQAGLMLILVVVMFAALWLPVHIHLLLQQFRLLQNDPVYEAISVLWNLIAYFNSCVNPIIYNRTSKEFRDAFVDACRCGRGGIPASGGRPGSVNRSGVERRFGGPGSPSPEAGRPVSLVTRLTPDGRRHASADGGFFGSATGGNGGLPPLQRSTTASDRLLVPPSAPHTDSDGDVECSADRSRRKSDLLTVPPLPTFQ